jgi:hypothetical protein
MARRKKAIAVQRPTLEEIKAQEGRFVVALLGLPEEENQRAVGTLGVSLTWSLPPDAPGRERQAEAYVSMELFKPKSIDESWLDNYEFQKLYEKHPSLMVFKADTIPDPINTDLPPRLEKLLTKANKQTIILLCTTPYFGIHKDAMDAIIKMDVKSAGEPLNMGRVKEFRQKTLFHFLTAWREMEKRFQNRKEIIRKITERIDEIEHEGSESRAEWLIQV